MSWPEYTLLALLVLGVGINLAKHGETRNGEYNVFTSLFGVGITFTLLWFGGFF